MTALDDPALTLRTKTCLRCGETKPWAAYYANTKWPDGSMRSPMSWCKACDLERVKANRRKQPEVTREKARERIRRRRAEINADPQARADYLARQREYAATYRRKIGKPPKKAPQEEAVRLPAEPLADWIRSQLAQAPGLTAVQVSIWFDVDESVVRSWLDGHLKTVDLDRIDRALTRLGLPHLLNELWPLTDQETTAA